MTFPAISYGRAALYPLQKTKTRKTSVVSFVGDGEQRWVSQQPVHSFNLVFTDVDGYSVSVLREFWEGAGGASTSEFDITLAGITYDHLVFDSDTFQVTTTKPNRFTVTLAVRQTRA